MGALTLMDAGMLTTVQDLGRPGFASIGVPEGGAADPLALRIGNRLLGNPPGAAGLEMTLVGGTCVFEDDAEVALSGGEVRATIEPADDRLSVAARWCGAVYIRAGQRLRIGPVVRGARAYLCIRGGVRALSVLGSASTLLSAGFGGVEGRALRAGDRIEWNDRPSTSPRLSPSLARQAMEETLARRTLRATSGSHHGAFAPEVAAAFWRSTFTVSSRSDRMGVRLAGSIAGAPGLVAAGRMASEGMPCGAVQVPPSGEPIALLVDHPTTGGYPVIACVASVDLPVLGQLRPGDRVRFEEVSREAALALLRDRERPLAEATAE